MRKIKALLLVAVLVVCCMATACGKEDKKDGKIKIGVVNNPPSESGYREANVKDMENVFSAANGYELKTFYSKSNDEQLQAAKGFITEGVDYLLISAAETTGWDDVLKKAKDSGVKVYLFDRMINVDASLYEAAVVSDMAKEGETAVNWLLAQNLPEEDCSADGRLGRSRSEEDR